MSLGVRKRIPFPAAEVLVFSMRPGMKGDDFHEWHQKEKEAPLYKLADDLLVRAGGNLRSSPGSRQNIYR